MIRIGRVGKSTRLLLGLGLGRRVVRWGEGIPAWSSAGGNATACCGGVFGIGPLDKGLWCVGYEGHGDGTEIEFEECCDSPPYLWDADGEVN